MDFIDTLQPVPPNDAIGMLPRELTPANPAEAVDLSPARLEQLAAELHDLYLDCLRLARRATELTFSIVGHNEIAALNARLVTVQAANLRLRAYHRSAVVSAWPSPPLPANVLLSPADLIPYLSAALVVLGARRRLRVEPVEGASHG